MEGKIEKPIHCLYCNNVLMKVEDRKEFKITLKCRTCKAYQTITSKKHYIIEVAPKLSTDGKIKKYRV